MIPLEDLFVYLDRYLMIPLDTDRSLLSAYLIKCLWFKSPTRLWIKCGESTLRMDVHVYKHSIVGHGFRTSLDRVRMLDPKADMLAVAQLRVVSAEVAEMPELKRRDPGKQYAQKHLDRQDAGVEERKRHFMPVHIF